MNDTHITVQGWVGSDVSVTDTVAGPVASFRVGSTPRFQRGEEWRDGETAWFTVKAWRGLAAHVAASVRNGQPVLISGKLVVSTWRREDGTVSVRHEVVARSVGHDLSWGSAEFTRAPRAERADVTPDAQREAHPESPQELAEGAAA
jgi:single-strand DNA-binding protein